MTSELCAKTGEEGGESQTATNQFNRSDVKQHQQTEKARFHTEANMLTAVHFYQSIKQNKK